ncbi:hypothetical protein C8J57DRAFT_1250260 [Mycena rebaudengoi]|nr:hypothetical protein C8J57DRAFT_1250260 [Mycena rebaudengoi]
MGPRRLVEKNAEKVDKCGYNSLEMRGASKETGGPSLLPSSVDSGATATENEGSESIGDRDFQLKTDFRVGGPTRDSSDGAAELVGGLKHLRKQKWTGNAGGVELARRAQLWSYYQGG